MTETDQYEPDPVFINSRRETVVILLLFAMFLAWSIIVSMVMGWESTYLANGASQIALVWGMPSWVFYGVFCPWMTVNLVALWFCFGFMREDELGDADSVDGVMKKEEDSSCSR